MPRITPSVTPATLGRRARALSGPVTGLAAGNSVVTSDMRNGGQPASFQVAGTGPDSSGSSTGHARQTGLITPTTPDLRRPDQSRAAYGGGWSDGRLTLRERFIQVMRGTSRQGAQESHSGIPNPQEDGPPAPQYLMDNRTESWQIGTDKTTQEDNSGPFATTVTTQITQAAQNIGGGPGQMTYLAGRQYPLGNQGDPWSPVWGGTPGLTRAYGARGPAGVSGPAPKTFALPGDGSGARVGTLLSPGDPTDGPQKIRGGVPHGLHSPTVQSVKVTLSRLGAIPVQKPPRDDRPNNSKIAGLSMSQMYPAEGSTSSARTPRATNTGRRPGINDRFRGSTS
jgi:hypothetical protein